MQSALGAATQRVGREAASLASVATGHLGWVAAAVALSRVPLCA